MANALHYVRDKVTLVAKLEAYFSSNPNLLIVEYETIRSTPWVPYPVSFIQLKDLFTGLGYHSVIKLASKPSRFGGTLYSAHITK